MNAGGKMPFGKMDKPKPRMKRISDEEIVGTLSDIQPDGFIWGDPTTSEMVKFRAIADAQLASCQDDIADAQTENLIAAGGPIVPIKPKMKVHLADYVTGEILDTREIFQPDRLLTEEIK